MDLRAKELDEFHQSDLLSCYGIDRFAIRARVHGRVAFQFRLQNHGAGKGELDGFGLGSGPSLSRRVAALIAVGHSERTGVDTAAARDPCSP